VTAPFGGSDRPRLTNGSWPEYQQATACAPVAARRQGVLATPKKDGPKGAIIRVASQ